MKKNKLEIIFDVGANNGDDSDIYLKNRFKVIAVECNPKLSYALQKKYKDNENIIIENKCISNTDNDIIPFYISKDDIWSSCIKGIAERKDKSKCITVNTITLNTLFKKYETPKYCKIDIEGYDIVALNSLKGDLPEYISCESECQTKNSSYDPFIIINKLHDLGYKQFQLCNQYGCSTIIPWELNDDKWLDYNKSKNKLKYLRDNHEFKTNWSFWYDIIAKI